MKACILNSETNICENIIELDAQDFVNFIPYKTGIKLAPDHTGHIGWTWDTNENKWIEPPAAPVDINFLATRIRRRRDKLLQRYVDCYNPLRWAALSPEQQTQIADYRQALLDLPEQPGFPQNIQWPLPPQI